MVRVIIRLDCDRETANAIAKPQMRSRNHKCDRETTNAIAKPQMRSRNHKCDRETTNAIASNNCTQAIATGNRFALIGRVEAAPLKHCTGVARCCRERNKTSAAPPNLSQW
ncbi:MAG: hypothetical protein F6K41_42905 [Symploca sp. SIO3E6]|nr:hypothetical protein [Caldora sp. SIO3E6]